jgi:hypothetical protein
MFAWVDPTNGMSIRVVRSTNSGVSWLSKDPQASPTTGTPGIHHVSGNTWVLVYSKWSTDDAITGRVIARVTTDDGSTWGSEILLTDSYRALYGVTVTGHSTDIRIGFAWAARTTGSSIYNIRTLKAHVSGSSLVYDGVITSGLVVRTQPQFTANDLWYVWTRRTTSSIFNTVLDFPGTSWGLEGEIGVPTVAGPALAGDGAAANLYVFGVEEH